MNRNRAVLRLTLLAAVGFVQASTVSAQVQAPLAGTLIPQFVQPLPTLGNGIPVVTGAAYTLSMCEFQANVLPPGTPGVSGATWVWGYVVGNTCPSPATPVANSYIGPVVVATRGTPTQVTYVNQLGTTATTNVLAYKNSTDQTLMWADPLGSTGSGPSEVNDCAMAVRDGQAAQGLCADNYSGPIPAAPHLHGGEIPAMLDGGPDAWWTADGKYGHGYYSKNGFTDAAAGKAVYVYPNTQEAAPIWFHDHTLGATRLNVYAGIAGAYVVTDPKPSNPNYPGHPLLPKVSEIIPVVIQDRTFDTNGQLLLDNAGINPEHPFWVPEFVGDTIVVNGKAWPYLNVRAKRYRFLFLNGSNARAYELSFGPSGPAMYVIGNDGGYLDRPVKIDPAAPTNNKLVIMPGERYDVIIDFRGHPNRNLVLTNTAGIPYPLGDPPDPLTTGNILQVRVGSRPFLDLTFNPALPWSTVRLTDRINRLVNPATGTVATGVTVHKTRRLTLNEALSPDDAPLEILVNNTKYVGNSRPLFNDFKPITTEWNTTYYSELPYEGETEIWEIVNLTVDAHPIHPHLVDFQVLNRQAFDQVGYEALYNSSFPGQEYVPGDGPPGHYNCGGLTPGPGVLSTCVLGGNPDVSPFFTLGPARPPTPAEVGWKDTVIAYPGEVTRIVVRFAPTTLKNTTPAAQGYYEFSPDGGHGYAWHCHIIDHEDNEMMRPFSVFANPAAVRKFRQGTHY